MEVKATQDLVEGGKLQALEGDLITVIDGWSVLNCGFSVQCTPYDPVNAWLCTILLICLQ